MGNQKRLDPVALRADFPILAREVNGRPLAYLDNAASSQRPRAVISALEEFYRAHYANIHRGVHTLSEEATAAYEGARDKVAAFIHAPDRRGVIFTRSILIGAGQLAEDAAKWQEKLAREIERSLESARAETPDLEIGKVILTGARMPGLAESLAAQLAPAVESVDSLAAARRWPKGAALDDEDHRVLSLTPLLAHYFAID